MSMPDLAFVKPFVAAAVNVLELQAQTRFEPGKPFLKETQKIEGIAIAAVVGVVSPKIRASVAIDFPAATYLHLLGRMLGEEQTAITDENQDGASEFLNMIFGQAKTELNKTGLELSLAIPTVIRGSNLELACKDRGSAVILPFEAPAAGKFWMEFCLAV